MPKVKTFYLTQVTDSRWDVKKFYEVSSKKFYVNLKTKKSYLIGDLNLSLLDHRINTNVKEYLNLTFQNFLILVINKLILNKLQGNEQFTTSDYSNQFPLSPYA